jgi:UDP-N-acetyl-D-galactosamine dehydrogenase
MWQGGSCGGNSATPLREARVGVLGLTFKENVPDIRNSRVPDIIAEFRAFGINAISHDPLASPREIEEEYGIRTADLSQFRDLNALVLAVPHREYLNDRARLLSMIADDGILADVKSALDPKCVSSGQTYWSL